MLDGIGLPLHVVKPLLHTGATVRQMDAPVEGLAKF